MRARLLGRGLTPIHEAGIHPVLCGLFRLIRRRQSDAAIGVGKVPGEVLAIKGLQARTTKSPLAKRVENVQTNRVKLAEVNN